MIRARLTNGELTTYIGPDPNGGHVIRTNNGDLHTIDDFTPELGHLHTPQWLTSVYQGPIDGICTWPTLDDARKYQAGQHNGFGRIVALGQLITHQGLYVIADTTGTPLRSDT